MKTFEVEKSRTSNDYHVIFWEEPNEHAFTGSLADCLAYIELKNDGRLRD